MGFKKKYNFTVFSAAAGAPAGRTAWTPAPTPDGGRAIAIDGSIAAFGVADRAKTTYGSLSITTFLNTLWTVMEETARAASADIVFVAFDLYTSGPTIKDPERERRKAQERDPPLDAAATIEFLLDADALLPGAWANVRATSYEHSTYGRRSLINHFYEHLFKKLRAGDCPEVPDGMKFGFYGDPLNPAEVLFVESLDGVKRITTDPFTATSEAEHAIVRLIWRYAQLAGLVIANDTDIELILLFHWIIRAYLAKLGLPDLRGPAGQAVAVLRTGASPEAALQNRHHKWYLAPFYAEENLAPLLGWSRDHVDESGVLLYGIIGILSAGCDYLEPQAGIAPEDAAQLALEWIRDSANPKVAWFIEGASPSGAVAIHVDRRRLQAFYDWATDKVNARLSLRKKSLAIVPYIQITPLLCDQLNFVLHRYANATLGDCALDDPRNWGWEEVDGKFQLCTAASCCIDGSCADDDWPIFPPNRVASVPPDSPPCVLPGSPLRVTPSAEYRSKRSASTDDGPPRKRQASCH